MRALQFTDEQMLHGLTEAAAELGEPMVSTAYDSWQRGRDAASLALVVRRFGSWNKACTQAGIAVNLTRSQSRRWSEEDVVGIVARFLAERGKAASFAAYSEWAREQDDVPSGATLRQRYKWAEIKKLAGG